jgi:hypothetical protein
VNVCGEEWGHIGSRYAHTVDIDRVVRVGMVMSESVTLMSSQVSMISPVV